MIKAIVLVGQTGSGKTDWAIDIAQKFNGEIICADSRTIYKGMDIVVAKPNLNQQSLIKHHCLDIVDISEKYSVANFVADAQKAIDNIIAKGKLPTIVGGSGLYVDALVYKFQLNHITDKNINDELSITELQKIANEKGLNPPTETMKNKQHLISYINRLGISNREKDTNYLYIGIQREKQDLDSRLKSRALKMINLDSIKESELLRSKFGAGNHLLKTSGYSPLFRLVDNEINQKECIEQINTFHKKVAKKQKTWFKKNPQIKWVCDIKDAEQLIEEYLLQ